jgi:hypothetical protein
VAEIGEAVWIPPLDAFPAGTNAGTNTCPACGRHWLVTPWDDYFVGACRHHDEDGKRMCESCGLGHIRTCPEANRG